MSIGAAVLLVLLGLVGSTALPVPFIALGVVAVVVYAIWTWVRLRTRLIVDEHGITVSLGGFWARPTWPVADFRTVQLRELAEDSLGVTVGSLGWRRGRVLASRRQELTALPGRKIFTTGKGQDECRLLVTRPGTAVEIIGRGTTNYLLTPDDPRTVAAAVDQAIRARR
jgi:hypothetical protein